MEGFGIRSLVEIEVTTEYFVGSFTTQHHLDTHAADDACQQIHRGRGTYGRHVVGLDVVDHVTNSVQTLLNRIVDFVVNRSDIVGHLLGSSQVRRTLQTYGKRV